MIILLAPCGTVDAQEVDMDGTGFFMDFGQESMGQGFAQGGFATGESTQRTINNLNEGIDVFGTTNAIDLTQVLNIPEFNAELEIESFDEHVSVQHEQDEEGGGGGPRRSNPQRQGAQNPRNLKRTKDEKKKHGIVSTHDFSKLLLGLTPKTISTSLCKIDVSSGSAALVVDHDDVVTVFDLHDEGPGGVTLTVAGKSVPLHPGDEIVLCAKTGIKFADLHEASIERVAVRNVKKLSAGSESMYQAEFSIPHCLTCNPDFRKALQSTDVAERLFARKMMKTAVIMNMITSSHGEYKPVTR